MVIELLNLKVLYNIITTIEKTILSGIWCNICIHNYYMGDVVKWVEILVAKKKEATKFTKKVNVSERALKASFIIIYKYIYK